MSRTAIGLAALSIVGFTLAGCAAVLPPTPAYTPQFTFAYPAANEPPAGDVTVAIIRPIDVDETSIRAKKQNAERIAALQAAGIAVTSDSSSKYESVDEAFRSSMVAQLQELFNTKGFKQRGPFEDLNAMTFPDKKGSDLTLTPQIGIRVTVPRTRTQGQDPGILGIGASDGQSVADGPCTASGFVSFVILEPLSGEKLWIKKVDVPSVQVDCSGKAAAGDTQFVVNGYAHLLEQVYQAVMKKAWEYLSSEELAVLKKQAQELRTKKVY